MHVLKIPKHRISVIKVMNFVFELQVAETNKYAFQLNELQTFSFYKIIKEEKTNFPLFYSGYLTNDCFTAET